MPAQAVAPATGAPGIVRFPLDPDDGPLPACEVVGSKALNLLAMGRIGLPVPPGFVIATELCRAYMEKGPAALKGLKRAVTAEIEALEERTGRRFGGAKRPLLVSVRSGAPVSMPGMMETVLNVGLTPASLTGLVRLTGNPRLAQDCMRRLVAQYGEVVHALQPSLFEDIVATALREQQLSGEHELDTPAMRRIVDQSLAVFDRETGKSFPDDPVEQLLAAIESVLKSWNSDRAKTYRKMNAISDDIGTATIVQMMVFGNAGPTSGSGVGFTRSPSDGANVLYCDYLQNAQGEDVVSGRRTALGSVELQQRLPAVMAELHAIKTVLEKNFTDMQDFEFTVESGRLYMLQTRSGKRTPLAALRIAHDLVAEGLLTPPAALKRLRGLDLANIEIRVLEPGKLAPAATATPASAGVTVGLVAMDPARVEAVAAGGDPVILLCHRLETSDIAAVAAADAIVTAVGARTSHAAVVARQLGKVCIVGCSSLRIDPSGRSCRIGEARVAEGDAVSVDGTTGEIYLGALAIRSSRPEDMLAAIAAWPSDSRAEKSEKDRGGAKAPKNTGAP
jgi:pyruvate,orthophosphate dikinase